MALHTDPAVKRRKIDSQLAVPSFTAGTNRSGPSRVKSPRRSAFFLGVIVQSKILDGLVNTHPPLAPDDGTPIIVDDTDEDIGTSIPRGSSPDQLDILSASPAASYRPKSHPSDVPDTPRSVKPDGPSTIKLRQMFRGRQSSAASPNVIELDDDPIEDCDDQHAVDTRGKPLTGAHAPNRPLGSRVRDAVKKFETEPVPRLDLGKMPHVRKSMKGKNTKSVRRAVLSC